MNSSTLQPHKGIIFDTNVVSKFAKVNRLDLLRRMFTAARAGVQLYITPAIQRELEAGVENEVDYLADALQLIDAGHLQVVQPTKADQLFINSLPAKLALGEAEAIALCYRLNLVLISHDRKAINYCNRVGISCIRLTSLLDGMKTAGLLTESEIEEMLA